VKHTCIPILGTALLAVSVSARPVQHWPYSRLFKESGVVVVATIADVRHTDETKEILRHPTVGVRTTLEVLAVFKGAEKRKRITLHHFRFDWSKMDRIANGPGLVHFDANDKPHPNATAKWEYVFFLSPLEQEGHYVPVTGQVDPDRSVRKLVHWHWRKDTEP
jgi:hypothetical protein